MKQQITEIEGEEVFLKIADRVAQYDSFYEITQRVTPHLLDVLIEEQQEKLKRLAELAQKYVTNNQAFIESIPKGELADMREFNSLLRDVMEQAETKR